MLSLHPGGLDGQQTATGSAPSIEVPGDASPAQLESLEARLRSALQLTPNAAAYHADLADVLRAQGRLAETRAALAEAIRLAPSNVEYGTELGRAHLELEEWVEAEIQFERTTRLAPGSAQLQAGLAEALLGQDRPEEASRAFARAAALDPGDRQIAMRQAAAESLAIASRESSTAAASPLEYVLRALRFLAAVLLSVAGLGLVVPIAGAALLLFVAVPIALIRQRHVI